MIPNKPGTNDWERRKPSLKGIKSIVSYSIFLIIVTREFVEGVINFRGVRDVAGS